MGEQSEQIHISKLYMHLKDINNLPGKILKLLSQEQALYNKMGLPSSRSAQAAVSLELIIHIRPSFFAVYSAVQP